MIQTPMASVCVSTFQWGNMSTTPRKGSSTWWNISNNRISLTYMFVGKKETSFLSFTMRQPAISVFLQATATCFWLSPPGSNEAWHQRRYELGSGWDRWSSRIAPAEIAVKEDSSTIAIGSWTTVAPVSCTLFRMHLTGGDWTWTNPASVETGADTQAKLNCRRADRHWKSPAIGLDNGTFCYGQNAHVVTTNFAGSFTRCRPKVEILKTSLRNDLLFGFRVHSQAKQPEMLQFHWRPLSHPEKTSLKPRTKPAFRYTGCFIGILNPYFIVLL